MAVKISILDSPWLVFLLVWIVLAGIFWEIWTSGRYFLLNFDYWSVFFAQFGLMGGNFGPVPHSRLADIFGRNLTNPSRFGRYFSEILDYWPVFFDQFGLVLKFGQY